MAFNKNIYKDRSLYPLTEPNSQGKQTKLGIDLNDFNGAVDGLKFSHSFAKGEAIYYTAPPGVVLDIIKTCEDVLRKRETHSFTVQNGLSKKRGDVNLTIGRDDTLTPYIQLSGNVNVQGNMQRKGKKFFFAMPKGFSFLVNGERASDLEVAERRFRNFSKVLEVFLEDLLESYSPADFNQQGGGQYGNGGYQNRGQNNNQNNNQQQNRQQANTEYNPGMFD